MTQEPSPPARYAPRIEPPAKIFTTLKPIWPWLWRTYHVDFGLRGFGDLLLFHWANMRFDRRYGVRTEYLLPKAELGFDDPDVQEEARRYRATPPFPAALAVSRLSERLGGLGQMGLIDYGSGAGRVLILGAEAGLKRVVGLEYGPALVAQCNDNVARYIARSRSTTQFDVLQTDATRYLPPPDTHIFYFFHPFSYDAFLRTLDYIRQSVREHPREIYVMVLMSSPYSIDGMDLIGAVTGVQTYTNALDPEAFLAADTGRASAA